MARALGIGSAGVWAVVGAGGKTAAIRRLLGESPRAVATTTTHLDAAGFDIGVLAVGQDVLQLERMEAAIGGLRPATFALGGKRGRLRAPPADWLQRFADRHRDALLFVEADGARRRLVKLPAANEPAWPPLLLSGSVVVVGCEALGQSVAHSAHRPAAFRTRGGSAARITSAHLEAMLERYLERAPRAPITVLLTGVDAARLPLAQRLAGFAAGIWHARGHSMPLLRVVATADVESGRYVTWIAARSAARPNAAAFADVCGVLLAAGRGVRFGSAPGVSKVLAPWRGRSLLEYAVDAWLGAGFGHLCVVTGEASVSIAAIARGAGRRGRLEIVHNPDYARGLGTSVARAARAAPAGSALLYGHADMPALRPDTLRRIAAAGVAFGDRIVVPTVGGAPRNPAYFPADLRPELARVEGESGGKQVQAAHPERVFHLAMDDVGDEFIDVDRRSDLRRLPRRRQAAAAR